jgi:hypothetical protein
MEEDSSGLIAAGLGSGVVHAAGSWEGAGLGFPRTDPRSMRARTAKVSKGMETSTL